MNNKTLIGAVITILLSNTALAQSASSMLQSDCEIGANMSAEAYDDAKNGISVESRVNSLFRGADTTIPTYQEAVAKVRFMITNGHKAYQQAPNIGSKKFYDYVYAGCIKAGARNGEAR